MQLKPGLKFTEQRALFYQEDVNLLTYVHLEKIQFPAAAAFTSSKAEESS